MIKKTNLSILIVGGNETKRDEKAGEFLGFDFRSQTNNPDFLFLYSSTSIGIEEIRNLIKFLSLKPFFGKNKTVLIKEAQNLTIEAQNSLLKTLEEPPVYSQVILLSPSKSLLLSTVISRCQIFEIPSEPQVQLNDDEIMKITDLLKKIKESVIGERFNMIEELGIYKDRETAILWLDKLTFVVRKLMLSEYLDQSKTSSPPPIFSSNQCLDLIYRINQAKYYLHANCNIRLTVEVFLTNLTISPRECLR